MSKPEITEELAAVIRSARGSLKGKMGDEPFAVRWARYKQEEKELGRESSGGS